MTTLLILPISFILSIFIPKTKFNIFLFIKELVEEIEDILKEKVYKENKKLEILLSIFSYIIILSIAFFIPLIIIMLLYKLNIVLGFIIELVLFTLILNIRTTLEESSEIANLLESNDNANEIKEILEKNINIDTQDIEKNNIIKRTIEYSTISISENYIYLLLLFFIGGIPLCFVYKIINTISYYASKENTIISDYNSDNYFNLIIVKTNNIISILLSLFSILSISLSLIINKYKVKEIFKHILENIKSSKDIIKTSISYSFNIMLGGEYEKDGEFHYLKEIGNENSIEYPNIKTVNRIMLISSIISICILVLASFFSLLFK